MSETDIRIEKSTKVFIYATIVICTLMGVVQLIKGIPVTPIIDLVYIILVLIVASFRRKFSQEVFSTILGVLGTYMVLSFSFFTGGFSAPVIKWLLPIFIYTSFTVKGRPYVYYISFLFLGLFTCMFLDFFGLRTINYFNPENAEMFQTLSTILSIFISLVLIRYHRKESRELEENYNKLFERNNLIIKSNETGIWDWEDFSKDDVYWSEKLYDILKLDPKTTKPKASVFNEMMVEGELERSNALVFKQLETQDNFATFIKMNRADGKQIWVHSTGIAIRNENGDIVRMVGGTQDVTELVEAREQALEASRAKSLFLSNMTHEIRTPLNAILGLTEVLKGQLTEKENVDLANDIYYSGEILFEIVSDILDINKIQDNKVVVKTKATNLCELLDKTKNTYMTLANKKGLELKVDYDLQNNTWFKLDDVKVQQIINNLLTNAIKFTDSGEVNLKCSFSNEFLEIKISDTGIGIEQDQLNLVFDSFQQLDSNLSKKYRGTGLGLYIVKELVELMGGTISLESELNIGTSFSIRIPVEVSHETIKMKLTNRTYEKVSSLRVLVAEDNKLNAKVVSKFLSSIGVDYKIVENGKKAVEEYSPDKYDIILMDLQMPEMDGIEASTEIVKSTSQEKTPYIIALTANATEDNKVKTKECGMSDFLTKPVKKEHIVEAFEKYIVQLASST